MVILFHYALNSRTLSKPYLQVSFPLHPLVCQSSYRAKNPPIQLYSLCTSTVEGHPLSCVKKWTNPLDKRYLGQIKNKCVSGNGSENFK